MLTVFLGRADVARHLQAIHLLGELRAAFTAGAGASAGTGDGGGGDGARDTVRFAGPLADTGSTVVRRATLPAVPASCVTVQVEPTPGRGERRALLQLHEAGTGKLLAVMDASHLLALKASVLSALAADVLARPEARNVAVLGAGPAASSALKALRLVRSLERVRLYEPDLAACTELALRLQTSLSMAVRAASSAAEAVLGADLVVLTGGVTLPEDVLYAGAHVTVLGAERFPAAPVPAQALARALRVGDQREAPASWALPLHGSLGEVLGGLVPGRADANQLTLFASTGPAFLDLLVAWHVYEGARHDETLTRLDLEA
jgi:alanine dehydrogenase